MLFSVHSTLQFMEYLSEQVVLAHLTHLIHTFTKHSRFSIHLIRDHCHNETFLAHLCKVHASSLYLQVLPTNISFNFTELNVNSTYALEFAIKQPPATDLVCTDTD